MSAFPYQDVENRADGDYIRLLTLAPSANHSEPVHATLSPARLEDVRSYEALSYCWGDASQKLPISCDGHELGVTVNLNAALRQLRYADVERVLWIDAICIDQSSLSERAHQVTLMREIYGKAARVVIWLGEAGGESDLVFNVCERVVPRRWELLREKRTEAELDRLQWGPDRTQIIKAKVQEIERRRRAAAKSMAHDGSAGGEPQGDEGEELQDPTDEETAAFFRLLERPWFSRCWVVQEAILGKDVCVMCGDRALDWEIFNAGFLLAFYLSPSGVIRLPEAAVEGALILVQLVRGNMQLLRQDQEQYDLSWLVWKTWMLQATDPRDKVYSILGLVDEDQLRALGLAPDYTVTVEECYRRTTLAILREARNLDVLITDCLPKAAFESLPSWVPDWSVTKKPLAMPLIPDYTGTAATENRRFAASGGGSCDVRTAPGKTEALVLSGYTFDRIVEMAEILTAPRVDYKDLGGEPPSMKVFTGLMSKVFKGMGQYIDTLVSWEKMALAKNRANPTGEDLETMFATTMCLGDLPETGLAGFHKWRTTLRAPKKLSFLKKLGIKGGAYQSLMVVSGMAFGWQSLDDRLFSTATGRTLNRRLARTAKGHLCVVPAASMAGDQVTLFRGGRAPFVTRARVRDGPRQMVGVCYVHGIMYGEGWDEALARDVEIV